MKKILILLVAVASSFTFYASAAQNASEGPVVDAGVGVGVYDKVEGTGVMFTQRVGVQWPVAKFGKKLSLSAGAYINNAYGSSTDILELEWNGKEIDELDFKTTRDDISILPTASLNYSFSPSFEGYFGLGLGVGILTAKGSIDFDGEDPDDYAGAEDLQKTSSKVCFAMSSYLGIRYYFSSNWAVNAQFGLIAGNFKSHAGSYNLLSAGVSYRF